jgi:hypothetical protein
MAYCYEDAKEMCMDFVNGRNMREGPCRSKPLEAKFCMDKAPGMHDAGSGEADQACVNGVWGNGWRHIISNLMFEPASGRMSADDVRITWADKSPTWFTKENNYGGCNQFML